jgi:hypothetical protein
MTALLELLVKVRIAHVAAEIYTCVKVRLLTGVRDLLTLSLLIELRLSEGTYWSTLGTQRGLELLSLAIAVGGV